MLLVFGTYSHPPDEVEIASISKSTVRGKYGLRTGYKEQWTIRGRLSGATQADLTTAILALEAAHNYDGHSLTLYTDSGSTSSAHYISAPITLGGVKVVSLSYPNGRGAEYATFRNYEIVYEAEVVTGGAGLLEFDERVTFLGGGPQFEHLQCIDGPPVKIWVAQQTPYRATQSGSAVGMGGWPAIPAPLFPDDERRERRQISNGTPQNDNGGFSRFPVAWSYEFEAANPLFAYPSAPA